MQGGHDENMAASNSKCLTSPSQTSLLKIAFGKTEPQHQLTAEQLGRLVDPKSVVDLAKLGGLRGIAASLGVSLEQGVTGKEQEEALRGEFGANVLPHPEPPTFLWFLWTAFNDRILIFLTIAALVSLGIGIYNDIKDGTYSHWIEGAAIMAAVAIVVLVNAMNDWQKDRQFRKLSAKNEDRLLRVLRSSIKCQVSIFDLVVGDVLLLDPGVHIPHDQLEAKI